MSQLEKRSNNALRLNSNTVNGVTADIAITTHGSNWYFAVCAIMTVSAFAFIGMGMRRPRRDRIFHYITASIVIVAAIAYFSMGSNLGFVPIAVTYQRSNPKVRGTFREIFYVRYIDWFITTPLLLMDLMLTAGMPWPTIFFVILIDWVMIVTGLIGALVRSTYKWGYFTFGCVALGYIVYHLVWESRRNANRLGRDVGRAFLYCGVLTSLLWILYPIAWGVCEGGNVISPDSEAVFYGILDILAKPVFGAILIWGHRNINPATLGLAIRDYDGDEYVTDKRTRNAPLDAPVGTATTGTGHTHAHTTGAATGYAATTANPVTSTTGTTTTHVPHNGPAGIPATSHV